jgi:hypothetical protein
MVAPPAPSAVRSRAVTVLVGVLGLGSGCPGSAPSQNAASSPPSPTATADLGDASVSASKPQFIDVTYSELYQIFLNHGLSDGEKAQRWSREYRGRWIRWTGQLAYIRTSSLLFRQLGGSSTQDVFLFSPEQRRENPTLTPGRFYNYVGRLSRYDDLFRTFYLDHGMVLGPDEFGVPGTPYDAPPVTRKLPGPPCPLPWPPVSPIPTAQIKPKPELATPDGGAVP